MPPTLGNGKICYLVIPARNPTDSATFYQNVFGWTLRRRGDGAITFDDGVGEVSGTWTTSQPPVTEAGLLLYVMCDSVEETIAKVTEAGGEIVQPIGVDTPEITARFRDPAGNILGLYQNP